MSLAVYFLSFFLSYFFLLIAIYIYFKATLAAHYLSLNNCFSTILCAQDCYLDDGNNLKVGGAWMGEWKYGLDDIVNHDWYWRFIAPETLTWKVRSSSSLVWNLGVFIWQLTTLCYFLPFPQRNTNKQSKSQEFRFLSRRSYLEAINNRKLVLFNNQNKDLLENYSLEMHVFYLIIL
uniref:Pkinase_Tyr domain-containing protein n=1 Tax=Heterorhabditis bacteriophora TaxID=37862 RepID=A0A1I7XQD2_HETBA